MLRLATHRSGTRRIFTDDERRGRTVVVLTRRLERRFGASGDLGRVVQLDGETYTAIGVMPRNSADVSPPSSSPLGVTGSAPDNGRTYLVTIAQLADGVSWSRAGRLRGALPRNRRELAANAPRLDGSLLHLSHWQ